MSCSGDCANFSHLVTCLSSMQEQRFCWVVVDMELCSKWRNSASWGNFKLLSSCSQQNLLINWLSICDWCAWILTLHWIVQMHSTKMHAVDQSQVCILWDANEGVYLGCTCLFHTNFEMFDKIEVYINKSAKHASHYLMIFDRIEQALTNKASSEDVCLVIYLSIRRERKWWSSCTTD